MIYGGNNNDFKTFLKLVTNELNPTKYTIFFQIQFIFFKYWDEMR